jgi:DNA-binding NtrC family response regulator
MTFASLRRPPAILLVDDDEAFRASIVRLLHMSPSFRSAAVRQASNGAEAIDYLRQNRPDCLLLDYQMPGENGLHWLRRAREKQVELPVIMITGEGSEEVAVEAMKSGATISGQGQHHREALYRALSNSLDKARLQRTIGNRKSNCGGGTSPGHDRKPGRRLHNSDNPPPCCLSYLEC